jgi:hypothetical protein
MTAAVASASVAATTVGYGSRPLMWEASRSPSTEPAFGDGTGRREEASIGDGGASGQRRLGCHLSVLEPSAELFAVQSLAGVEILGVVSFLRLT